MRRRCLVTLATSVVVGAALVPAVLASVRPDDRAGVRGADVTGVTDVSPAAAHPDNRAGPRGADVSAVTEVSSAAAHPDSRPGPRGAFPVASPSGTDWTAITTGIAVGVAALLVVGGVVYTRRHGGWQPPHRPAHTH